MLHLLGIIYNWSTLVGAIVGLTLQRLECRAKAKWDDKRHPLPGGEKHAVPGISHRWIASTVFVLAIGYVLFSAEKARDYSIRLNNEVVKCWAENYNLAKKRAEINDKDASLANELSEYRDELEQARTDYTVALTTAPPFISKDADRRVQYLYDITKVYAAQQSRIMTKIKDVENRKKQLDQDRRDHPLPEATCGRQ